MNEKNIPVIIDALVDMIKKLRIDVLVRDSEIEHLKDKLKEKETSDGKL